MVRLFPFGPTLGARVNGETGAQKNDLLACCAKAVRCSLAVPSWSGDLCAAIGREGRRVYPLGNTREPWKQTGFSGNLSRKFGILTNRGLCGKVRHTSYS